MVGWSVSGRRPIKRLSRGTHMQAVPAPVSTTSPERAEDTRPSQPCMRLLCPHLAPVREPAKVGSPDVQSAHYWSATTSAENPTNAWNVSTNNKLNSNQVWCVRGEHDAPAVVARGSVQAVSVLPAAYEEGPQRISV